MAAKKGAQIQFHIDVSNDEEWNKLFEKKGLTSEFKNNNEKLYSDSSLVGQKLVVFTFLVVDVYSEWCGQCTAMVSSLKKLKLEIGSEYLHFALAKSDTISSLERFRDKSEPTWMFIASGHLVNLMFGVNAPKLIHLIKTELEIELNVLQGKLERKSMPFNELTEAEKQKKVITDRRNEEKLKEIQNKLEEKMNLLRERSLMKLAKTIPTFSCIVYFPHVISADGSCAVAQKMMFMNDSISVAVVDQIKTQLNVNMINKIFYKCPVYANLPKVLKKSLENKPILGTLLQIIVNNDVSEILSPRNAKLGDNCQIIEQKLSKLVYGCVNPIEYTEQSVAYEFIVENEDGDKLQPMWTPTNVISKAAAIEILFPRKVESVGYVPAQLPPPQLIIIYDSAKVLGVMELINEYKDAVFKLGFFNSIDPQNAKLICKTYEQFCNLPTDEIKTAKMVIAIKKGETEDILLEFSQVIPLYISPNEEVGTDESDQFFLFDYDDDNEEVKKEHLDYELSLDENKEV